MRQIVRRTAGSVDGFEAYQWANAAARLGWRVVSIVCSNTGHWSVWAEASDGEDPDDWDREFRDEDQDIVKAKLESELDPLRWRSWKNEPPAPYTDCIVMCEDGTIDRNNTPQHGDFDDAKWWRPLAGEPGDIE